MKKLTKYGLINQTKYGLINQTEYGLRDLTEFIEKYIYPKWISDVVMTEDKFKTSIKGKADSEVIEVLWLLLKRNQKLKNDLKRSKQAGQSNVFSAMKSKEKSDELYSILTDVELIKFSKFEWDYVMYPQGKQLEVKMYIIKIEKALFTCNFYGTRHQLYYILTAAQQKGYFSQKWASIAKGFFNVDSKYLKNPPADWYQCQRSSKLPLDDIARTVVKNLI